HVWSCCDLCLHQRQATPAIQRLPPHAGHSYLVPGLRNAAEGLRFGLRDERTYCRSPAGPRLSVQDRVIGSVRDRVIGSSGDRVSENHGLAAKAYLENPPIARSLPVFHWLLSFPSAARTLRNENKIWRRLRSPDTGSRRSPDFSWPNTLL